MTADDLLRNRLDAPYLTARYGEAIRYTLNPPGRRRGASDWDAGPPEDWCQMPAPSAVVALAATEGQDGMSQPMATRIDRLSRCHDMTPCNRNAPHWPDRAASPDSINPSPRSTHGTDHPSDPRSPASPTSRTYQPPRAIVTPDNAGTSTHPK
jgi:hypothetical protein